MYLSLHGELSYYIVINVLSHLYTLIEHTFCAWNLKVTPHVSHFGDLAESPCQFPG